MKGFLRAGAIALPCLLSSGAAVAEDTKGTLKIGILNDQSGPYSEVTGKGSVIAARLAVEDFGATVLGRRIEILAADHQNKPDIGSAIARQWYDVDKVGAIFDVPTSSVALAVLDIARSRNKVVAFSGPSTSDITGKLCAATSFHWSYDSYALATAVPRALLQQGAKSWFFLTVDGAAGVSIERDATKVVLAQGGQVLGSIKHALNTQDFSSFLLQAQQSNAQVIGLANAGHDAITSIRQASEFGIPEGGQRIAGLLVLLNDIHALGLTAAHGVVTTESFYWDMNDAARAWSKRFMAANGGTPPNMVQAGVYSAVFHYLKAVAKAGTEEGTAVAAAMKAMPVEDFYTIKAAIRADGRVMRDMYLFEVKTPSGSNSPWDIYKLISRIAPDDAFRPLAEGGCPLVH